MPVVCCDGGDQKFFVTRGDVATTAVRHLMTNRDTDWFIEQVRREQAALRAFVRSLGVRAEAVDDVAQEALILAFEKLAEFDRAQEFGPWVRGMARRLVANLVRKESRREELMSRAMSEAMLLHESEGPSSTLASETHLQALRQCLGGMPEQSRRMVQWRYFEDLSPAAIADRLGRTANDVRQIFFRLRRALLECIEQRLANPDRPSPP
jgi:RNA polymerase sigma-70 factor (ECF subfamily)